MKKISLTILLFIVTLISETQATTFLVVDTTTPSIGASSSTGLLNVAGTFINTPYWTTNANYPYKGDLLPTAFQKINGNFVVLSTVVLSTNATANGQVAIATNTGGTGYTYYWGTLATGGSVTATNAIASTNGVGTATIIVLGNSIGATNFNVLGIGPKGGTITFPNGAVIQEQGTGIGTQTSDHGLSLGYGLGGLLGENGSMVFGGTNDVRGTASPAAVIQWPTIGGGLLNFIGDGSGHGYGSYSVVAGGASNTVVGIGSVISGGVANQIGDIGNAFYPADYSFIPGGISNNVYSLATNSTAGGMQSSVLFSNSWIWNDDSAGTFSNTAGKQFLVHAANGVGINTNVTGTNKLVVNGNGDFQSITIKGQYLSVGGNVGIPTLSGTGTNISLVSTTMLTDISGLLIPNMSSDTAPSGTASASSGSSSAYLAFTNSTWTSSGENDAWVQYQFPEPVVVDTFIASASGIDASSFSLEYSLDGVSWITNYSSSGINDGVPTSMNPVLASYFRWDFPFSSAQSGVVGPLNLIGGYANYVTGSSLIQISSPYGVSICSTNFGTNKLEVGGTVNAKGYLVDNVPFGTGDPIAVPNQSLNSLFLFGTNFIGPAWFFSTNVIQGTFIVSTNAPTGINANPIFGGLFLPATNTRSYFTNINGIQYVPKVSAILGAGAQTAHPLLCSNFNSFATSGFPYYLGASWYGTWNGIKTLSGGTTVSDGTQVVITSSNSVSAYNGSMTVNTNDAGTSQFKVLGNSDSTTYTLNGAVPLTTNIQFVDGTVNLGVFLPSVTNTLYFTNGLLMRVTSP